MKKFSLVLIIAVVLTACLSTFLTFKLIEKGSHASIDLSEDDNKAKFIKNNINISPGLLPENFVTTSEKVTPAIVNIIASRGGERRSNGSGVIISEDGYIITNNHVVNAGGSFEVTTNDKRSYIARLIGTDPTTDLALLKVDANENLPTIDFGNSDDVKVGEWVLAVGNPFNLTSTVTLGIISAKARNINILPGEYSVESFLQTDAVVNPGNSGGGLVNAKGELIGINAAILTETGSYEGYSFAIPSNLVRKVINDLMEFGEVKRAILGIRIQDVDETVAQRLNLPVVSGVLIDSVNPNSSAEEAGLQAGDVIIEVNGRLTESTPELQEQVARFRPGEKLSLKYIRNGKKFSKTNIILKGLAAN